MQITPRITFEYGSALFAFLAAGFWFATYLVRLPQEIVEVDVARAENSEPKTIDDFTRLTRGLKNQSRLNAWAAAFAGVSAVLQGFATFIGG
jgi:hypothetical protein